MFNPQQSLMLRNFFIFKKQLVNYRARNWPKTFWGFGETHTRTLKCECIITGWTGAQGNRKTGGQRDRNLGEIKEGEKTSREAGQIQENDTTFLITFGKKWKAEEIEKTLTAVHNILQSKKCRKVGAYKKGVGPGIKGQGKWEVWTPYLPQQSPT